MLSSQQIRDFADEAAYRAARDGATPLVPFDNVEQDIRHVPFLGTFKPAGWRHATWTDLPVKPASRAVPWSADTEARVMVDSSGFGAPYEPALTFPELVDYVTDVLAKDADTTFGFGIEEAGEFQIVMGVYVKDPTETTETGVPEPSDRWEGCYIHEECDGEPCQYACGECNADLSQGTHETWCSGRADVEVSRCPACGDPIDYCQGHGEIGDPDGYAILQRHDDGNHSGCHPDGCPDWTCPNCGADASTPHWVGCPDKVHPSK